MKILKKILLGLLIFIGLVVQALFVLKHNLKREIITLDRRIISEKDIDRMASDAITQMTTEEKLLMMTPGLKSMLKFMLK